MNVWKIAFFVAVAIFVLTNIFWSYSVMDAGIAHSYQQSSLDKQSRTIKVLGALVVDSGQQYSKKDFLDKLRKVNGDVFIIEKDNYIDVDGVKFIFVKNRLSEIKD